jgi:hypothetical protein
MALTNSQRQAVHKRRKQQLSKLYAPVIASALLDHTDLFADLADDAKEKRKGWTVLDTALLLIADEMVKKGVSVNASVNYVKSIDPKEFARLVVDEDAYFGIVIQPYDEKSHGPAKLPPGNNYLIGETRDAGSVIELLEAESEAGAQGFTKVVSVRPIVARALTEAVTAARGRPPKGTA